MDGLLLLVGEEKKEADPVSKIVVNFLAEITLEEFPTKTRVVDYVFKLWEYVHFSDFFKITILSSFFSGNPSEEKSSQSKENALSILCEILAQKNSSQKNVQLRYIKFFGENAG